MPGFRAGKKEDKLGWRASDTCELILEDVEVPMVLLKGAGVRVTRSGKKLLDLSLPGDPLFLEVAPGLIDAVVAGLRERARA